MEVKDIFREFRIDIEPEKVMSEEIKIPNANAFGIFGGTAQI